MLKKVVSIKTQDLRELGHTARFEVVDTSPIVVGVRSAGEVGFNIFEFLAMRRGGYPIEVHYFTREKYMVGDGLAKGDRLVTKSRSEGKDPTSLSNYSWAGIINGLHRTGRNTRELVSPFGRLSVTIHFLPDRNLELEPVREIAESGRRFLLVDATGNVKHNDPEQSPLHYLTYPRLLSVETAPAKKAKRQFPHMLEGVNIGSHVPEWFDACDALDEAVAAVLHTGSCTTHAGAVAIYALDKNIKGFRIISGNLTSIHAKTPTDNPDQLEGNFIAQTTGFADAAKIVLPTRGIEKVDALAIRSDVFGASINTITLMVKADEEITREKVIDIFRREAEGDLHEQVVVLSERAVKAHSKKNFAVNSAVAMKGILHTTIIDPSMVTVFYDEETNTYQINIKVAYYDNVAGFTYSLLREISNIAGRRWRLSQELFPHGDIWDYTRAFSFFNSSGPRAEQMFGTLEERWDAIGGPLLEGQPEGFARRGRASDSDRID